MSDLLNGIFEAGLAYGIYLGILQLRKDKQVKGVFWPLTFWTSAWGIWNLYYYPSLGQWFSFWGGLAVVTMNLTWLGHVIHYKILEALEAINAR